MLQIAIICGLTLMFFTLERLLPGRTLPEAPGWYVRALFLNACQLGIVLLAGIAWNRWFQGHSLFHLSHVSSQVLQGFTGWFIGTFVFYWWHRARHDVNILWRVCHQVHHSPARIEMLTAFYKHPVEIAADSVIMSALVFSLLGASLAGAAWFNVFAVFGEYFYHSNLRTPHWLGYFLQRPEQCTWASMSPGKRVRPRPSTTSAFATFNSDPPIRLILPSSISTLRCSSTCSPSKTRTSRMSCEVVGV